MSDRRRFLHIAGAAAVTAALPACGPTGKTKDKDPPDDGSGGAGGQTSGMGGAGGAGGAGCPGVSVGAVEDYASEGLHLVPNTAVLIGRDAGGLYALSSICTHNHCNMNSKGQLIATGIRCICHGSRYDPSGKVTLGPAVKSLLAYALSVDCDGGLYADLDTPVPNTDRFPV